MLPSSASARFLFGIYAEAAIYLLAAAIAFAEIARNLGRGEEAHRLREPVGGSTQEISGAS